MKKRGLAILIAVLGVLCVVCGALLLLLGLGHSHRLAGHPGSRAAPGQL